MPKETKITVTLAVDHETMEEGYDINGWVERELGWLHDSGIYLVEIKEIKKDTCHLDGFGLPYEKEIEDE